MAIDLSSDYCRKCQKEQSAHMPAPLSGARAPAPLSDLRQRLDLLTKYGVRSYRDGMLSIDLDPSARLRDKKPSDEQPFIPPP